MRQRPGEKIQEIVNVGFFDKSIAYGVKKERCMDFLVLEAAGNSRDAHPMCLGRKQARFQFAFTDDRIPRKKVSQVDKQHCHVVTEAPLSRPPMVIPVRG